MTSDTKHALTDFYRARIAENGYTYKTIWGEPAEWKSDFRFQPLLSLPFNADDVIVDIGCGLGDLAAFLRKHGVLSRYIGVEAVPELAEHARAVSNEEVLELDVFSKLHELPPADWYVSFGTLNKSWNIAGLEGEDDLERIYYLLDQLYSKARKGVAISVVTDVVDYFKPGVVNVDPIALCSKLKSLSPHFSIFHGYPFYEFYAAVWRAQRY